MPSMPVYIKCATSTLMHHVKLCPPSDILNDRPAFDFSSRGSSSKPTMNRKLQSVRVKNSMQQHIAWLSVKARPEGTTALPV
jgi:hypothetical protein